MLRNYAIALLGAMVALPVSAASILGSSANFAVLGSTVTNTGATSILGDLGASSVTAITGVGTIALTGMLHSGDPVAQQASSDAADAFAIFAALPTAIDLTGQDLGTFGTLTPGVYKFATTAQLTGALVLDFASNPGGSFIFLIGTTLTTASASSLTAVNGDAGSGLFFNVGTSATLGTGTVFTGNILAAQSITLNMGVHIVCGRAIALNAAITLDSNAVSSDCGAGDFHSRGFSAAGVPEPASWAMMVAGFGMTGAAMRSRRRPASKSSETRFYPE
jgi:type VI secretion system secreted protein VgrG